MICWADKPHETTVHYARLDVEGRWVPCCSTRTAGLKSGDDGERAVTCEKCLKKLGVV